MHIMVPPIKCQGIKTKLIPDIKELSTGTYKGTYIEPFCGSCVVALNLLPPKALLCDINVHIINFYNEIKSGVFSSDDVRDFLLAESEKLNKGKQDYYYEVRARFNSAPSSLDFLFLNRSCFNGVMRFNRKGHFNVPFCHKPERFAQAYITKITNQVKTFEKAVKTHDWYFVAQDFRITLSKAREDDLVYADPPYAGRHVDYFNSWSEQDQSDLDDLLMGLPSKFILSSWMQNSFRTNPEIEKWRQGGLHIFLRDHFYHVGSTESLRHPMVEALVANFPSSMKEIREFNANSSDEQMELFG